MAFFASHSRNATHQAPLRWAVAGLYVVSVLAASLHPLLHHGSHAHGQSEVVATAALQTFEGADTHHTEAIGACAVCATLARHIGVNPPAVCEDALEVASQRAVTPPLSLHRSPTRTAVQRGPPVTV